MEKGGKRALTISFISVIVKIFSRGGCHAGH